MIKERKGRTMNRTTVKDLPINHNANFRAAPRRRPYVSQYLKVFFAEKNLPEVNWELRDNSGQLHWISNAVVIEQILCAPKHEQKAIGDMIRKLDFHNANVNDYLKHLAGALINRWA